MASEIDRDTFDLVRSLIYRHSGIHLSDKEEGLVRTRLGRRLKELGLASFQEYAKLLRGPEAAQELPALVDSVTTNYTFFFREPDHFRFFCAEAVPRIVERRAREGATKVRGWSAGCSSGEEPYSIAMSFVEADRELPGRDFRLLATDINRKVLRAALRGAYPEPKLSRVPPDYYYKYLVRDGLTPPGWLRVCDDIRRLVVFRRLNIVQEEPAMKGLFDFIFCRNVMIYFDSATQEKMVRRFEACLRPGGYLFIAPPECIRHVPHKLAALSPTVYRKP